MSSRGRPPKGADLVDALAGSESAKKKIKLLLRTLTGELDVPGACCELGLSESGFHRMRNMFLQEAVELLEPKAAGRPANGPPSQEQLRIESLENQVQRMAVELMASHAREQLAAAWLLRPRDAGGDALKKRRRP